MAASFVMNTKILVIELKEAADPLTPMMLGEESVAGSKVYSSLPAQLAGVTVKTGT